MKAFAVYASLLIAGSTSPVRIGDASVLDLPGDPARADRATATLQRALADPDCGPEGLVVVRDDGATALALCGARFLELTEEDAVWEGRPLDETAERWAETLRERFQSVKAAEYSRTLLRRAIAGLLYPILLVTLLLLARLGFRRWRERLLEPPGGPKGIRLGPLHLLATPSERRFLAALLRVVALAVYVVLGFAFVVALFRQIPRTQAWARSMVAPVGDLGRALGEGVVELIPRLLLAAVLIVAVHLLLRAVSRLFEQVRRGERRIEPFLTEETAGAAELTVRFLVIAAGLFLATLLVPGSGGKAFQFGFLIAGAAAAIGAWRLTGNLIAGVVTVFARRIHRGDRVRFAGRVGTIVRKGALHVTLEEDDGGISFVPNDVALREGIEILGDERRLSGEVVVRSVRGIDAAVGLIRHAAVEAGLRRDGGRVDLHVVRDGRLVFRVDFPLDRNAAAAEIRSRFLRGLLEHAPGLQVEVVSALAAPPPAA